MKEKDRQGRPCAAMMLDGDKGPAPICRKLPPKLRATGLAEVRPVPDARVVGVPRGLECRGDWQYSTSE